MKVASASSFSCTLIPWKINFVFSI